MEGVDRFNLKHNARDAERSETYVDQKVTRAHTNKLLFVMDAEKDTPGKHVPCLEIERKSSQLQGVLLTIGHRQRTTVGNREHILHHRKVIKTL